MSLLAELYLMGEMPRYKYVAPTVLIYRNDFLQKQVEDLPCTMRSVRCCARERGMRSGPTITSTPRAN